MTQPGCKPQEGPHAEEFEEFRDWIHRHSGIYLDSSGWTRCASRSSPVRPGSDSRPRRVLLVAQARRARVQRADEPRHHQRDVVLPVPGQFDALSESVVPEILESKSKMSHAFRAWSAGCSTGEEPYTIAMSLLDSQARRRGLTPRGARHRRVDSGARSGAGGASTAPSRLRACRSTSSRDGSSQSKAATAGRARAGCGRVLVSQPDQGAVSAGLMGNWDVIFCRNVTIYFKFESTRRVVNNFFESLNPGGYLFIGHSETLTSISDRFEAVEIDGVFLYRKPRPRRLRLLRRGSRRPQSARHERTATARRPHSERAGRERAADDRRAGRRQPARWRRRRRASAESRRSSSCRAGVPAPRDGTPAEARDAAPTRRSPWIPRASRR